MSPYALTGQSPLAWGGWLFTITGPVEPKQLEWWPGDSHLFWQGRPFRAAPVAKDSGKAARAAAQSLVDLLNEDAA